MGLAKTWEIHEEKLSSNITAGNEFKTKFTKMAVEEGYSRDIYNADKKGLNWRSLPRKSLASKPETCAPSVSQ